MRPVINVQAIFGLMATRGMNNNDLITTSGLAPKTVHDLGKSKTVHFATVGKLAKALGVEPQAIIKAEG